MKYIFLINAVVIGDLFPNAGPEFRRLDMCLMKALVQRCVCVLNEYVGRLCKELTQTATGK